MKKISALLLVVLCVLALSSCASVGYEKAPSWLRGKTWTGFKTYIYEGGSFTEDYSFAFHKDGTFSVEDYWGSVSEDLIITTSNNANTYQITFVGPYVFEGVESNQEYVLSFTKISNNECELNVFLKDIYSDGSEDSITRSVTLCAN